MPEFIAIPVGKGDAFYLNTGEKKILVDGGRSRCDFPEDFRKTTNETELDVVVCTHADADHSNGIIGLLRDNSNVSIGQIWLPAIWADRLRSLLTNSEKFFTELTQKIDDLHDENIPDSISTFGDRCFEKKTKEPQDTPKRQKNEEEIDRIQNWLAGVEEDDNKTIEILYPDILLTRHNLNTSLEMFDLSRAELKRMNLFYKAVAVANKIATIATRAAKKGIKIRWFEYSSQSRGGESYLKPVNSVELSSLKVGRYNALEYLGLSSADKMSLVYNAPLEESGPPVLFSAESLFDFSNSIPWKNNMLITAPHHGSEANAVVYEKLEDYEENNEDINPVWVRSDSENHHRPCEEYINASGNRFCTVCNNPPRNKQPVKLKVKKGKWVPEGNTNKCHCK